ncbi:hypothetical protein D3C81_2248730 [compost metagenome]
MLLSGSKVPLDLPDSRLAAGCDFFPHRIQNPEAFLREMGELAHRCAGQHLTGYLEGFFIGCIAAEKTSFSIHIK